MIKLTSTLGLAGILVVARRLAVARRQHRDESQL
jgi:hypothetical protein